MLGYLSRRAGRYDAEDLLGDLFRIVAWRRRNTASGWYRLPEARGFALAGGTAIIEQAGFVRLAVDGGSESTTIDLGIDARIFPAEATERGQVLPWRNSLRVARQLVLPRSQRFGTWLGARIVVRADHCHGEPARTAVLGRIAQLPEETGLIGPRTLVPIMAGLQTPRRLNFLSAEALALAVLTEATVAVRTDSPPLREACQAVHVGYRVVDAP